MWRVAPIDGILETEFAGRLRFGFGRAEESPDSTEHGAGQHPGGATRRTVQQRADRRWPQGTGKGETVV